MPTRHTRHTVTAHLGSTYKNRTVEIWADPFGSDKPNKLVKSGKVNSSGNLTVTLDLTRDAKVTAKFAGYSRYKSKSVSSTVGAKVKVSTAISGQYKKKGYRMRVRSSYYNGTSGDNVNSTTHGDWKYFIFTS